MWCRAICRTQSVTSALASLLMEVRFVDGAEVALSQAFARAGQAIEVRSCTRAFLWQTLARACGLVEVRSRRRTSLFNAFTIAGLCVEVWSWHHAAVLRAKALTRASVKVEI